MVLDDGLNVRLVMHVLQELEASFVSYPRGTSLESVVTFEEILHIDNMYPVIISRMSNEYDVLSKVMRGRLIHSSAVTRAALLSNTLPSRSRASGTAM
jgi:hypothetical protein